MGDIGTPQLLHEFFDVRSRQCPAAIAIDIPSPATDRPREQYTYDDLARRSRAVTARLAPILTGESPVALMLPRTTVDAYAAQLGILRAGGAYVAIDPTLPDSRVAEILGDAEPVALVTDPAGVARAQALGLAPAHVVQMNGGPAPADATDAGTRPPWLTPRTLAYVIYTSGTTGRPKGVMIEHRSIANLVASDLAEFRLSVGDRALQNSSHSYDSSVEEIWLALASGATLVVADDDVVRSGPDLVAWLDRESVTVLCPSPTLLRATGCRTPADTPPRLRLVYVGGEQMPPDVVDVWAPGRRLINGYGPTEGTVTDIRMDMNGDRPISIGRPIAGVDAWILDDDLNDVADGDVGELCLGKLAVARGYWNAPALTATKFVTHPSHGRLYRTGDLASRSADGRFYCHGRRDGQVKIRGHRVELGDVEAHLVRCTGVRAAACTVDAPGLTAFVVARDPQMPPVPDAVLTEMRRLVAPHMVPTRILLVDDLPTTTGGKLDRSALPAVASHTSAGPEPETDGSPVAPPLAGSEATIAHAVQTALNLSSPVGADTDFFTTLSMDSLGAAELVTTLRQDESTSAITVRDVYQARTVRALARIAGLAATSTANDDRPDRTEPVDVTRTTVMQIGWLTVQFVAGSAVAGFVGVVVLPWLLLRLEIVPFILLMPVLAAALYPLYAAAATGIAIAAKRRFIGRYVAGREPAWGRFYLRHWIVQRSASAIPWGLIAGTEFQSMALRALGARVGRRVHLHRGVDVASGGWDLLTLGDDVTVGQEASLRLVDVDRGALVAGPITLEAEATIDTRATLGPDTHVGRGATVGALSSIPAGSRVPAGERWDGVPAVRVGETMPRSEVAHDDRELPPLAHGLFMIAARIALGLVDALPAVALAIGLVVYYDATAEGLLAWLTAPTWNTRSLTIFLTVTLTPLPMALLLDIIVLRALGHVRPGVISRWSPAYVRVWLKTGTVDRAAAWLSGALAWMSWLRGAGASIGKASEVSTIIDAVPEQLSIGAGAFCTDGIYLGAPRVDRGTVTMADTALGEQAFVGNHAVVPCGQSLANAVLIGVCTISDAARMPAGSSWFGHPAFQLPRPSAGTTAASAYRPPWPRYLSRLFWEWLRLLIPVAPALAALYWFGVLRQSLDTVGGLVFGAAAAPIVTLVATLAILSLVLGLKWLLLGRVRPGTHDFWSCWVFRWDFVYIAWQQLASPLLASFEGTLLLPWYLRAMGARIGRRVVLGRGFSQVVDPDMLRLGDDVTMQGLLQAHTFEERILKLDRVTVRQRATVASSALLFYGADVGAGTYIAPNSVVMKRERLPAGRAYDGCPTREAPAVTRPGRIVPTVAS